MKNHALNGGKADGLLTIKTLEGVNVPAFTNIPADATPEEKKERIQQFIASHPSVKKVAVRSSALQEDGAEASFAGAFETLLNVPATARDISAAVDKVQEHGKKKLSEVFNAAAEKSIGIVIQSMVEAPDFAGVCLSQGYGTEDNAYLLLNFRQGLGDDLVGGADSGKELRILRSGKFSPETIREYPFLPDLVDSIRKIEDRFGNKPMDMEFAAKDGVVYMLQARPFITKNPASLKERTATEKTAHELSRTVAGIPQNDLLCDMADINPRELLGHPALPVNIGLFRQMFADKIVEQAREEIGYAPLHAGLLREVFGKPYVSLRASAYSLRPEGISEAAYDKIVAIYRGFLKKFPDKQDSVEFDVFLTGSAQLPQFFSQHESLFTEAEKTEISAAFLRLDKRLTTEIDGYCSACFDTIEGYRQKLLSISPEAALQDMVSILQEGTALFVKTARLAFYQKALCDKLYGEEKMREILVCMDTPSEQLQKDLLAYAKSEKSVEDLRQEYGHIRPGQMNIFTPAYRDDVAKNLDLSRYKNMPRQEIEAAETENAKKQTLLHERLKTLPEQTRKDVNDLRLLFAAREQIKHEFMRAYDRVAQKLKEAPLPTAAAQPFILLPDVLSCESDLNCITVGTKEGTYFGKTVVEAAPVIVTDGNLHKLTHDDVEGKILIMDHADPGYDFLLLHKPAAIITKVGGPASHIAIRVNEYGIPACIGCGIDPASVDTAKTYVLDCMKKKHRSGRRIVANDNPGGKPKNAPHTP